MSPRAADYWVDCLLFGHLLPDASVRWGLYLFIYLFFYTSLFFGTGDPVPRSPMSYPQGYLYQPPGSLALYSCPAYGASALAAPRNEDLARSSSGSAFSPYPGSAAFSASAGAGFSSPLSYSADPTGGFPSYMVRNVAAYQFMIFRQWGSNACDGEFRSVDALKEEEEAELRFRLRSAERKRLQNFDWHSRGSCLSCASYKSGAGRLKWDF